MGVCASKQEVVSEPKELEPLKETIDSKEKEVLPSNLRMEIYSFASYELLLSKIAKLSKKERNVLI